MLDLQRKQKAAAEMKKQFKEPVGNAALRKHSEWAQIYEILDTGREGGKQGRKEGGELAGNHSLRKEWVKIFKQSRCSFKKSFTFSRSGNSPACLDCTGLKISQRSCYHVSLPLCIAAVRCIFVAVLCGCHLISWQVLICTGSSWILMGIREDCRPPVVKVTPSTF